MTHALAVLVRWSTAAVLIALAVPAAAQEFVVGAPDGDYRLQVGSLLQVDTRAASGAVVAPADRFLVRKARLVLDADVARNVEVRLVPDFAGGNVQLPDAYIETRFSTRLRVRAGRSKVPVGYELLIGDSDGWFPERGLPSSLVPNRDVGLEALGELRGNRLSYAAGIFAGTGDGASAAAAAAGSQFAARVVVRLRPGVGVHLGGSAGGATALPSFKTSIGQTYFSYAPGAVSSGRQTRVSPAAFVYRGPFGAYAEYARSTQMVALGGAAARVSNGGFAVSTSYTLTGEPVSDRHVQPRAPFDPASRQWGAVQLLARYGTLAVDRDAFSAGLAAATASRTVRQATLAVNWYPARCVKWYAAYEHTSFDRTTAPRRAPEHAGIVRAQVAF